MITTEFPGVMGHRKRLGFGEFGKHTTLWERPKQDDKLQKVRGKVVGFREIKMKKEPLFSYLQNRAQKTSQGDTEKQLS